MTLKNSNSLPRRHFLKVLAGVPLAFGLPAVVGRAFAGDEAAGCEAEPPIPVGGKATPESVRQVIDLAADRQRPVLAIATPPASRDPDAYARRQRTARRLAALLGTDDVELQLILAQLVIVVAPLDVLEEAGAARAEPRPVGHAGSPIHLIGAPGDTTGRGTSLDPSQPRRIAAALDADDDAAAALPGALRAALFGPELSILRRRADAEMHRARAPKEVRSHLANLGADSFETREAASKALADRRDDLLATLALLAMTSPDAEVRIRAGHLARSSDRITPIGAAWGEFHGGCGRMQPYAEEQISIRCGRGRISQPARIYLRLLGP